MLHTLFVDSIGLRAMMETCSGCNTRIILIYLSPAVALKFVYGLSMASKSTKSLQLTTLAYSLLFSINASNSISMVGILEHVHIAYGTSIRKVDLHHKNSIIFRSSHPSDDELPSTTLSTSQPD